jgi:hypothetical protein
MSIRDLMVVHNDRHDDYHGDDHEEITPPTEQPKNCSRVGHVGYAKDRGQPGYNVPRLALRQPAHHEVLGELISEHDQCGCGWQDQGILSL